MALIKVLNSNFVLIADDLKVTLKMALIKVTLY